MEIEIKTKLVNYLRNFATDRRWETIQQVLDQRTKHITVVLEDIYQSHNASAVLRSCDCFGIQDVHIIENRHQFDPSQGVTIGADQWLSQYTYSEKEVNNTARCYEKLREKGYRIIATTPHDKQVTIHELPVDPKTALVFGAELTGLSDYALQEADGYVSVPIFGFSESYNISVSAALCLYDLRLRLNRSSVNWKLTEQERTDLELKWLEKSIRAGKKLKEKFLAEEA